MLFFQAFIALPMATFSQTTTMIILNRQEQENYKMLLEKNQEVRALNDSLQHLAKKALSHSARPLRVLYYEGLLDTNPKRIDTEKSLEDVDAVVNLIYGSYGVQDSIYGAKAAEIVKAWAKTYLPTGNPINENKFVAFFWSFHLFREHFDEKDEEVLEEWMRKIAIAEMKRSRTPNNNWQAKRLKIVGLIGNILEDEKMQEFSLSGFKEFINTAYFADGTSEDLAKRDALSYHISGIKPCLSVFINFKHFSDEFDLYDYEGDSGGSIRKSVEYVIPYATGEKQHKEWVNTKVKLDKERAAAGIAKYQPGILFDPKDAYSLFECAAYYNPDYYRIIDEKGRYTTSWVGLLNSALVRNK
jgi:hypothetical protein